MLPTTHETGGTVTPVAVFYYPWYGHSNNGWTGGLGSSHWNDSGIGGIVRDTPELGYYSSMDNSVIQSQLSTMFDAGINIIILSWWGIDSPANSATLHFIQYLQGSLFVYDFKIAILVDAFNTTLSRKEYKGIYDYLWTNIYASNSNVIFKWEGKPLMLFFNPLYPQPDSRFTMRTIGNQVPVDWSFWKGMNFQEDYAPASWNMSIYTGNPAISSDGVVSISPRYDDEGLFTAGQRSSFMRFDGNLQNGMYQAEWAYVLQHRQQIKLVLINSYNEYHERSAIEATVQDQGVLITLTKDCVSDLQGAA